jgi:hypothetical protein
LRQANPPKEIALERIQTLDCDILCIFLYRELACGAGSRLFFGDLSKIFLGTSLYLFDNIETDSEIY